MPQALLDRPTLMDGLDIYLQAYQDLLHDRPIGMEMGTIPWSSIHRWTNAHRITGIDDIEVFNQHIRRLEDADRKHTESQSSKGTTK